MLIRFLKRLFGADTATSGDEGATLSVGELRVANIDDFYDTLEYRFVASAAQKTDMVFQYTITGDQPREFYIHVQKGTIRKQHGRHEKPTAGIQVDADDYVQMINGDMNPRMAYLKGKMKLVGRKLAAQKLQKIILLGRDAEKHYQTLKAEGKLDALKATVQSEQPQDTSAPRIDLTESMTAPYKLTYTYTRSTGPVIGQFLTGLRDGKIQGTVTKDGRVIVPALEYDPNTAAELSDFKDVADCGTVKTWSWIDAPLPDQPLERPFAWALIQLDGADTAMLHAVDAGSKGAMQTGMRVKANWSEERVGQIQDIQCFIPEATA